MANSYTFESGHVWADCCGSADCELCRGTGQARLQGFDAVQGVLQLVREHDVCLDYTVEGEAQLGAARAELGALRRLLHRWTVRATELEHQLAIAGHERSNAEADRERLALDVVHTTEHLMAHWPGVGGLPSVQDLRRHADRLLGRITIQPLADEPEPCRRVASEVR